MLANLSYPKEKKNNLKKNRVDSSYDEDLSMQELKFGGWGLMLETMYSSECDDEDDTYESDTTNL